MSDESGEAAATTAPPRWGLGDAILAFVASLVTALIALGIYTAAGGDENGVVFPIVALAGSWLGLVGVAVLASRRKGAGSLAEDFGLRFESRDVLVGAVAGLVSYFVLVPILVVLFEALIHEVNLSQQSEDLTNDAGGWRLGVLAPFIVVGAPLVEELYYRGLLQRALVRRAGPALAIALSGVIFGLSHANPDLEGWTIVAVIVVLTAFGAVLGWLAHRYGRLGPGIVAHATFNSITVIALASS
jgi:membrane protease YdiL (CAAX protease family)